MNRREFVKNSVALSLATQFTPSMEAATPRKRPNVLYVFSDEHRACSLPGEPYSDVLAPNIARFAKQHLSFRNCISNYPVCSPYRGIFVTGLWPYQSGIIDNAIQLPPDSPSIGRTFRDSGYYTGYIGKWHLSSVPGDRVFIPPGPARQGFEDWHVWANTNPHFNESYTFDSNTGRKIQPKGYNCTLMTDQAVKFLNQRKADPKGKPWLLVLSWNPPHPPFDDAPPEEKKLYNPNALPFRPNVKLIPKHSRLLHSEERLRTADQGYSAHITAVDKEFQRVLQTLEDTGQAENTIVVYTSDHGEMMGSHGYMGKRLPWEESCKPPFFIRYPGVTPTTRESDILFSAIDIYPSLCGLAGIPIPAHCAGRDVSGAMRGHRINPPESAFLMHIQKTHSSGGNANPAPLFRGLRTSRHTYAVADDGRWCLYDNREDPYQQHNLIADKSRAPLMRELDDMVRDWLKKASDPFPYDSLVDRLSIHSGAQKPQRIPVAGT
jgi:arylsulfatase A-like enzyme